VIAATHGKVTDAAVRAQVTAMLSKVSALGEVASVASPYAAVGGADLRSGQIAFANVVLKPVPVTAAQADRFVKTASGGRSRRPGSRCRRIGGGANSSGVSSVGIGAVQRW